MNDAQRECEKDARSHEESWAKKREGQLDEARELLMEWQSKYLYLQENEFLVGLNVTTIYALNKLFEKTTGFLDSTSC